MRCSLCAAPPVCDPGQDRPLSDLMCWPQGHTLTLGEGSSLLTTNKHRKRET